MLRIHRWVKHGPFFSKAFYSCRGAPHANRYSMGVEKDSYMAGKQAIILMGTSHRQVLRQILVDNHRADEFRDEF